MQVGPGHTQSRPGRVTKPDVRGGGRSQGGRGEAGSGDSRNGSSQVDAEALAGLLSPVVDAAGMDLESVRVSVAGRRRLLRVVVDADGGVSLDDIAEISREISNCLDKNGAMGETPYTLEVSSPGVERPLTEPRHWRRAMGRLVSVPLASVADGGRPHGGTAPGRPATVTGRVVAAAEHGVTLDVDGQRRRFAYTELGPGKVQVEFGGGGSPDGH
ncbi:MAG TPA: ribosome maturation factor RimP [Streptosporangiaceae bacterium]|nr:ribosome maturation factor RimP [Streptosporangiaceae bacterium]